MKLKDTGKFSGSVWEMCNSNWFTGY